MSEYAIERARRAPESTFRLVTRFHFLRANFGSRSISSNTTALATCSSIESTSACE